MVYVKGMHTTTLLHQQTQQGYGIASAAQPQHHRSLQVRHAGWLHVEAGRKFFLHESL